MSDQFIGQILADKFRVEEFLHGDATSATYRATHLLMDKAVTVKILAPELAADENKIKQFAGEARAVSRLSHPNILAVNDYGQDKNGAIYIISEGFSGETLDKTLTREEKLPAETAVSIARQIASALAAAHTAGITHRNLNPETIVFDPVTEKVKVLNFAALAQKESDGKFSLRQTAYLAPEQYSNPQGADERSDIYSLGVIFYEMLAGVVPFFADTPDELIHKKNEDLPAPLSAYREDFSPEIEPVILHSLAKNLAMRQQDAREFIDELERAVPSSDAENLMARAANLDIEEKPNNLWKTAFVVLAGISVLAIGLIYATSMKQTDPTTMMQTDANGVPVQPINPATGMNELGMANMTGMQPDAYSNSNMTMPEVMPGGDGYDPWARGGQPPTGAPPPSTYVPPSGNYVTVPGESGSPFMQDYVIVPVPANSNTAPQPSPTKTPKNADPNASPSPQPTPVEKPAGTPDTKPTPANTPKLKATPKPKQTSPATTEKQSVSGKEQDTN